MCIIELFLFDKMSSNKIYKILKKLLFLTLNFYKLTIEFLFSLFIPQSGRIKVIVIFTLISNINNLTPYNKFVLAFNILTLTLFLANLIIEYVREVVLNYYFKKDKTKAINNLAFEIQNYPKLSSYLNYMNSIYYKSILI